MDTGEIWRHIDRERDGLADVLDTLSPQQWAADSLCAGWSVRDVAAHLTHSHAGLGHILAAAACSGFRFDAMMARLVLWDKRTPGQITSALRGMVGSRRRPPTPTPLDPLMDVVVHGQDITAALGIDREMPPDVAVAVAQHLWRMRFPMNPRRVLAGFRLVADDADFAVGEGVTVRAPIRELVMILSGRCAPGVVSPDAGPA